jgi:demethylmenaquinone methyltransferase / 2-methoxy-6-polyprenyl-1,4-benzoquinol methylase
MFDMIAGRYDLVNRVLAMRMDVGWRKIMVQKIKDKVPPDARLLDIATGTADVALLLAEAMPLATVLGKDPSNNMLDVGRTKVHDRELDARIVLEYGDAQDFSALQESVFDGATMSFGIRNVPDRQTALCEIHRVLKPSAIFCILEFSEPDESAGIMGFFARLFIRHVVPVVGGVLSGKPREYLHLQNSIKDFPTPTEFGKIMETVNCGESGRGAFRLDELIQMNFGSVQLYVTTAIER